MAERESIPACGNENKPRDPRDFIFNIDFLKYVEILQQQKRFILIFCISAILTSTALTYIFSELYIAGTTVYYRPLEMTMLRLRNAQSFGAPVPSPPFKIISQTLNDLIKSPVILEPVVDELGLDKEATPDYDSWYQRIYEETKKTVKDWALKTWEFLKHGRLIEKNPTSEAISGLGDNLSISSTKESYIYILSVKDKYPARAAKIVDSVSVRLVEWLKQQDKNPAEMKRSQSSEQITLKEKKISSLREERDQILQREGIVEVDAEVNTGVQSLYSMQLEDDRVRAQIKEKESKLNEIRQKINHAAGRYIDPDLLKRLNDERHFTEIELKSLMARQAAFDVTIGQTKTRLEYIRSIKKQNDDIDMKINMLSQETQHVSDLRVEATGDVETAQSEVEILHPAIIPTTPVQPIKIYHIGLTAILSLFFSTGLVYVFAYFNVRIFFDSGRSSARHTT